MHEHKKKKKIAPPIYRRKNKCFAFYFILFSFFVFSYFFLQVALQSGNIDSETGVDASFELVHEMTGKIRTGQWVGDCFLFTNEVCIYSNGSGDVFHIVGLRFCSLFFQ